MFKYSVKVRITEFNSIVSNPIRAMFKSLKKEIKELEEKRFKPYKGNV